MIDASVKYFLIIVTTTFYFYFRKFLIALHCRFIFYGIKIPAWLIGLQV